MSFQVGGLVGQQGVGSRVGFVEAVTGKLGHQFENLDGFLRVHFALAATGQEFLLLRRHFLGLFFAHGAAQDVSFAQAEARQTVGDLHHLFLIDDHAVGLFQGLLQLRQ